VPAIVLPAPATSDEILGVYSFDKHQRHVSAKDSDATDAVHDDTSVAVEEDHLRSHLEDALVAGHQFLQNERPQRARASVTCSSSRMTSRNSPLGASNIAPWFSPMTIG
jgi:hypothetical protein